MNIEKKITIRRAVYSAASIYDMYGRVYLCRVRRKSSRRTYVHLDVSVSERRDPGRLSDLAFAHRRSSDGGGSGGDIGRGSRGGRRCGRFLRLFSGVGDALASQALLLHGFFGLLSPGLGAVGSGMAKFVTVVTLDLAVVTSRLILSRVRGGSGGTSGASLLGALDIRVLRG